MTGFGNKLRLYLSVSYEFELTDIANKLQNMLHDKSKKSNNRQWNNKTERYTISNTDEMQLRIMM